MVIFDLETDGLLDELTTIHLFSYYDTKTKVKQTLTDLAVMKTVVETHMAEGCETPWLWAGHNVVGFDVPAIEKVLGVKVKKGLITDTILLSRLIESDIKNDDFELNRKGKLPGKLIGSHSLEAWGWRLGDHKGEFKGPWRESEVRENYRKNLDENTAYSPDVEEFLVQQWRKEMREYCEQDVQVTAKLYDRFTTLNYSEESVQLEHDVAWIIERQIRYGVLFDVLGAQLLLADLMIRKDEIVRALREAFPAWYTSDGEFTPKRDNRTAGYTAGVTFTKISLTEFNPGSRQHIADRLTKLYGWKPQSFTESGQAEVNDDILKKLPYPGTELLREYFVVEKRLGQLSDGQAGWLKKVKRSGRIHGRVTTNGAVTGRMTHSDPNLAQVPSNSAPYGERCRSLFCVPDGKAQVGVDAKSLEGRTLAHYTSRYDDGAYGKILLEGDVHWENTLALGLVPRGTVRDKHNEAHEAARAIAKTWFYAWLYGAGDKKLAVTLGVSESRAKYLRSEFLKNASALGRLQADIAKTVADKGFLKGIDGRVLRVRSEHSALNTLLQSCGAIVMKKALVILDKSLQSSGLTPGIHYEFLLNVHDEWQIETDQDKAETVAALAIEAIKKAGQYFKTRVPMDGDARIGKTWAETH